MQGASYVIRPAAPAGDPPGCKPSMSFLHTISLYVHAWLGYVSWCMSVSDLGCKPFIAFLALLGASGGVLALVCLSLSTLLHDLAWELAERRRERRVAVEPRATRDSCDLQQPLAHAVLEERIEPVFGGVSLGLGMARTAWPDSGAANPAPNEPSPPAL